MAKKKFDNKNPQYTRTPTTAERSDLKTDVVEKLVTADETNVPEVGAEEIKKYSSSGLDKIPSWIKALFLKFWFWVLRVKITHSLVRLKTDFLHF